MKKSYVYDYPPSARILAYGDLVEDSHYFCKGEISTTSTTSEEHVDKCDFEVAYTRDGKIIVVCYLKYDLSRGDLFRVDAFRVSGISLPENWHVTVNNLLVLHQNYQSLGEGPSVITFQATDFEASYPNPTGEDIENSNPHFDVVGFPFLSWYDRNSRNYDEKTNGRIEFRIGDGSLKLLFRRTFDQRDYDTQATARLSVPPECIPAGWNAEQTADLWCSLISLATGRYVEWTCKQIYVRSQVVKQKWVTKHLKDDTKISPFVESMIANYSKTLPAFFESTTSSISSGHADYLPFIEQFLHSLDPELLFESQLRLITTLIEALLEKWEKQKNRQSFAERLGAFFGHYNVHVGENRLLQSRITAFIETRNAIVHSGIIASADEKRRNRLSKSGIQDGDEYYNAKMMFPIMLFCIFGYDGTFYDQLEQRHMQLYFRGPSTEKL